MAAITGQVTSKITGRPIAGALIKFVDAQGKPLSDSPMQAVSDQNGDYFFETLGGYYLSIEHKAHVKSLKALDIANYGSGGAYTSRVDVTLIPDGGLSTIAKQYQTPILIGGAVVLASLVYTFYTKSKPKTTKKLKK